MPQAFHQRVNHDKSGYYRASDRRLLLAMMLVQPPQSCQRCRWSSTSNQGQIYLGYLVVRSSMNLDQNKAIITLVLAFIAQFIIGIIIGVVFGVIRQILGMSGDAI